MKIAIRRTFLLQLALVVAVSWSLASCSSLPDRQPVPFDLIKKAQISGIPDVRALTFEARDVAEMPTAFFQQSIERAASLGHPLTMLAISGGGERGAFGAGVLYGWSEKGKRPDFDVVTGVSAGALLGPFAFLGKAYDDQMKSAFTIVTDDTVSTTRKIFRILRDRNSRTNDSPLVQLISRIITDDMITAIAQEHRKGRRFFVCTTHLDAQMATVWDMGAIAASGLESSHALFRKVLCASSSIPVAFPPVYFDVEVDGRHFDEMHADGGVVNQMFGAVILSHLAKQSSDRHARLFILSNAIPTPEWRAVKPGLTGTALRSIETLVKTQGIGDVYRTFLVTETNGIDFNLATIPEGLTPKSSLDFDQVYMQALFEVGRTFAMTGPAWEKYPPGFTPTARNANAETSEE